MTYEQLQSFLKGKTFLIGLTFVNDNGELLEQYQTHGTVSELTNDGLFRILRSDGSIFQMPYDPETISKAEKGEYREKSTGIIITDPDYMMTWEIVGYQNQFDDIKKRGYIPASLN